MAGAADGAGVVTSGEPTLMVEYSILLVHLTNVSLLLKHIVDTSNIRSVNIPSMFIMWSSLHLLLWSFLLLEVWANVVLHSTNERP